MIKVLLVWDKKSRLIEQMNWIKVWLEERNIKHKIHKSRRRLAVEHYDIFMCLVDELDELKEKDFHTIYTNQSILRSSHLDKLISLNPQLILSDYFSICVVKSTFYTKDS